MKLVWAYHDGFQTGPTNSALPADFIRHLFIQSILSSPSSYEKVIYTQEKYVDVFNQYVDRVEIFRDLEYVFLNDAKWYAVEKEENAIIIDGDLFLTEELIIPSDMSLGFEVTFEFTSNIAFYSNIFLKHGIKEYIPYWQVGLPSINTGLMYINDSVIKKDLLLEYNKVREFFKNNIEKESRLKNKTKQPSITGSQYFLSQYLIHNKVNYFNFSALNKFQHYFGEKKLPLLAQYIKSKTIYNKRSLL